MSLSPDAPADFGGLSDGALREYAVLGAERGDRPALLALLEGYLGQRSRRRAAVSPATLKAYRRGADLFLTWAAETGCRVLAPGKRDASRFITWLQARGLSEATSNLYLAGARALYRALRWADATEARPFEDENVLPDPTSSVDKNLPYGPEIETVMAGLHDQPMLRLLLLLCAHSGLRIAEALALDVEQVGGRMLRVEGKGGKTRHVPLSRRTREALQGAPLPTSGPLFDLTYRQASYRLEQAFRAAGLVFRGFHAARKYSASRLYTQTGDFTRVGLFLGHASVDTTRRYVKVEEHDVRDLIEEF